MPHNRQNDKEVIHESERCSGCHLILHLVGSITYGDGEKVCLACGNMGSYTKCYLEGEKIDRYEFV